MDKYRKIISLVLIILGCVGLLFSYILAQDYYFSSIFKKSGDKLSVFSDFSNSACGGQDSYVNCEAVSSSGYSKLFNLPIAVWGMIYFILMILLSLLFLKAGEKILPVVEMVLFWFMVYGTLFDLALMFLSIFIIKAVCSLCIVTYIPIWTSMILIVFYFKKKELNPLVLLPVLRDFIKSLDRKELRNQAFLVVLFLVITCSAGFGTNSYLKNKKETYSRDKMGALIEQVMEKYRLQGRVDVDPPMTQIIGNPDAPVTIVEFSDFLCPHCSRASHNLEKFVHANPSKVKLVFVNYPISTECNTVGRDLHPGSCRLARGAICASAQDKFPDYHDVVFKMKPRDPDMNKLKEVAKLSGLNVGKFETCMASPQTEKELQLQLGKARRLGVRSTPTIYINGRLFQFKTVDVLLEKVMALELEGK